MNSEPNTRILASDPPGDQATMLAAKRGDERAFGILCRRHWPKMFAVVLRFPLDAELADILLSWKLQSPYPQPSDWVFASPHKKGKQPYWPGALFKTHFKPALKKAGIPGDVGWHTLRHTFGTLMKAMAR